MIRYRFRQFVRGIMAKAPTPAEKKQINEILPPKAQAVFWQMNRGDQRHSLNVLSTALTLLVYHGKQLAEDEAGLGDIKMLLSRCCLLHDIGRGKKMGPVRKAEAVVLDKLFPLWARRYGRYNSESYIGGILYRYYHHAEISADMLADMGMLEEAAIVRRHHKKKYAQLTLRQKKVLMLLMEADKMC